MMNWEAVSAVGQIVSAMAVVISLIYLAVQIRQNSKQISDNTVATRAATYQESIAYDLGNLQTVGANPQTATVFWTFLDNPTRLEGGEYLQGRTLFIASIRHMENLYLQHEIGMLSDEAWATRERLISTFVHSSGFGELLSGGTEQIFGGAFIEYAKRLRESRNPNSNA